LKGKFTLGVVPTRRDMSGEFFCNADAAIARKNAVEERLGALGISYVNIDFLNEEGLIRNGADARKVCERFQSLGVDALFVPHVNFGCEDAVAKVAKLLGKPTLLWGMRDDAPDRFGNRMTDSQCGVFATGKVLRQFGVPFQYMTNCAPDDPVFEKTLSNFISAAHAAKSFKGMRVGQIGVRPETFWSVKCNELQLLERFGIEVVPMTLIELESRYKKAQSSKEEIASRVEDYLQRHDAVVGRESLERMAAMQNALEGWASEYGLEAVATSCWDEFRQIGGIQGCFVFSELADSGLPVACETDVHGAITAALAQAATRFESSVFFADITVRHPTNNNAELFWHCGNFPASCAACKACISTSFDGGIPGTGKSQLKGGDVTISRLDCSGDEYSLFFTTGKVVDGPATTGTYGWIEFKDWPKVEHKIACGPYVHHCAGVYGKVAEVLHSACRFIPGLSPDPVDPSADEIEASLR
jgi:L-fucose isomerase-like protein